MRAGPQLRVDAYGVRRYGSVIQVCEQPCATLTLQAFAKTIILGRRFYHPNDYHFFQQITHSVSHKSLLASTYLIKYDYIFTMIKHIASILSRGILEIDRHNRSINVTSKTSLNNIIKIPYSDISLCDWGYIYEKFVGQKYELEGYHVEYFGLTKGFLDGGMDILISKDNFQAFIQCKFSNKPNAHFGKQKIEWILYKASSYLFKQYKGHKLNFWLAVPTLDMITKKLQSYILFKNDTQHMVKIELKEIPMPI